MNDPDAVADRSLIPGLRAPLTPGQLGRMLVARWRWIAAVVAVFVLIALAAALLLPDRYVGRVALVIDMPSDASGDRLSVGSADNYRATQIDLLTSERVLLRVVAQQHLTDNADVRATFKAGAPAGASFERWLAQQLGKHLEVASGASSHLIEVRYTDPSPARAAALANAVVRAYRHIGAQMVADPARARLQQYTRYLDSLRAKVDTAQDQLTRARQQSGVIDDDRAGAVDAGRLEDFGVKLNQAESDRQAAQARVRRIRELRRQGRPVSAQAEILSSDYVQKLKGQLVQLQSQRSRFAETLGANHPRMQSLSAEIATVRARLRHEIDAYLEANRSQAETAADREAALNKSFERERRNVLTQQQKRDRIAGLGRSLDSAKHVYQAALDQYDQVLSNSTMRPYNISVVSWAAPPDQPTGLSGKLMLLTALFLGALAGGALALAVELFDRRVRHAEDVIRELKLPLLGEVGAKIEHA